MNTVTKKISLEQLKECHLIMSLVMELYYNNSNEYNYLLKARKVIINEMRIQHVVDDYNELIGKFSKRKHV